MTYAWVITKDSILDPEHDTSDVGVCGPVNTRLSAREIARHQEGRAFQMKDSDGALAYEGIYVGPWDVSMLDPLEMFGLPRAGCVEILFQDESGAWEAL